MEDKNTPREIDYVLFTDYLKPPSIEVLSPICEHPSGQDRRRERRKEERKNKKKK